MQCPGQPGVQINERGIYFQPTEEPDVIVLYCYVERY